MKKSIISICAFLLYLMQACQSDQSSNKSYLYQGEEVKPYFNINWIFKADNKINGAILKYRNNIIFRARTKLYCIDLDSGRKVWDIDFRMTVYHFIVDKNIAFCITEDSCINIIDANSGKRVWKYQMPSECLSYPIQMKDGNYCIGLRNGVLLMVDPKHKRAHEFANTKEDIVEIVDFSDELLCVQSFDNNLYAINKLSGQIAWKRNITSNESTANDIAHDDSFIYVSTANATMLSYNIYKKEKQWEFRTPMECYAAYVDTNYVFFGNTDGNIYSLNRHTGKLNYKFNIKGRFGFQPMAHGKSLYFGSENGVFYRINKNTGEEEFEYKADGVIATTPLIFGDNIYFGTSSNNLYCLKNRPD